MTGYRSIFLAPEWQHVRYLGWRDEWPHPDFRVMQQQRGPITRLLVLNACTDTAEFAGQWEAILSRRNAMTEICLHDLTGSPTVAAIADASGMALLSADQRLLNIATFAIDLSPDEDALFAAMSSDTRRKVRNAEKNGLRFDAEAHRDPARIAQFVASFQRMAGERALNAISPATVDSMIGDGLARLFAVEDEAAGPEGERSFLLSYESAGTGFFLYGASDRAKQNDGAGHLLQWGAIRAFRQAGHRWYDMGGLPALDSSNGIYRFKKGFGGELVELGTEFGWSGLMVRAARQGRALAGRLKGAA